MLTAALARMVAEPALRMSLGREARATAESLDITSYAQRLMEFYRTVIAGAPRASGRVRAGVITELRRGQEETGDQAR